MSFVRVGFADGTVKGFYIPEGMFDSMTVANDLAGAVMDQLLRAGYDVKFVLA